MAFCNACTDCLKPGLLTGSASVHRGERPVGPSLTSLSADTVTLYPGDGAYVPVIVTGGAVASLGPEEQIRGAGYHIVVMPSAGAACEAAPGVWNSKQTKGQLLVMNTSEVDVDIKLGDVVGGL